MIKYLDTLRSFCAKTAAESSEMPFGSRTLVGSRNHVLDGVQIPHGSGQF